MGQADQMYECLDKCFGSITGSVSAAHYTQISGSYTRFPLLPAAMMQPACKILKVLPLFI